MLRLFFWRWGNHPNAPLVGVIQMITLQRIGD